MFGNVSNGKCLPSDFAFLDSFAVSYHCHRVKDISTVFWKPSTAPWLKVNTDGSIIGGYAACGGMFKDHLGTFLGAFHAEILGFIYDIDYVAHNGWRNNWLESDSSSVLMIFSNASLVPVLFRNKWHNARSFGVQRFCGIFIIELIVSLQFQTRARIEASSSVDHRERRREKEARFTPAKKMKKQNQ
ncbi:hypothetical protein MTR_3g465360 [Medicago truncatula]|uniref:RNase H type-1 domain-containing protein n=1 Tax=Medicago truncatula TaxID=3880 RepID=A0A072UXV0_MEDTR|nr:hypothetical protein MTR_3g465360 [Medicago truncatula]